MSASPTPLATLTAEEAVTQSVANQAAMLESLFEPSEGVIRIGEWKDDPAKRLQNFIAGYIMVYGYDYRVELIDTTDDEYKDALTKGDVHLVMEADGDWIKDQTGRVIDAGSIKDAKTARIGVYGGIKQDAPEVVEFLGKMAPGDEVIASLAKQITGGRTGIRPNVAGLIFLKKHPETWTSWLPATVAEKVDAAINASKSSLTNRKCIPTGGSGSGDSSNCGT